MITIRNQPYANAALTWYHIWSKGVDLRLSGDDILDNRTFVARQWLRDTYRPRGATVVATLYCRYWRA
jgi:hypothetical protein